jgi:hypothetical protein
MPAVDPHADTATLINPFVIGNTSGGNKGTLSGVVATGLVATGPATITASVVQRADGQWGQRFGGTLQPGESITLSHDFAPAGTGFAAGDMIEMMCDYEVAATTGDLRFVSLGVRYTGGTILPQAQDGPVGAIAPNTAGYPASGYHFKGFRNAFPGLLRTVPRPLPATPNKIDMLITIFTRSLPTEAGAGALAPAAPVAIDLTFYRPEARKLPA